MDTRHRLLLSILMVFAVPAIAAVTCLEAERNVEVMVVDLLSDPTISDLDGASLDGLGPFLGSVVAQINGQVVAAHSSDLVADEEGLAMTVQLVTERSLAFLDLRELHRHGYLAYAVFSCDGPATYELSIRNVFGDPPAFTYLLDIGTNEFLLEDTWLAGDLTVAGDLEPGHEYVYLVQGGEESVHDTPYVATDGFDVDFRVIPEGVIPVTTTTLSSVKALFD